MKKPRYLVVLLCMLLASSGALAAPEVATEGFPIVAEPITLRAVGAQNAVHADWSTMLVWQTYEAMTNIHMQWDTVPDSNYNERKNLLLASGDLPDVFYRGMLSANDEVTYGTQGMLLDLAPLTEAYAPNFLAYCAENDGVLQAVTQSNGAIYSLPQIVDHSGPRSQKNWINVRYLEATGLAMPQTIDEFRAVLLAMKEIDYSGNGTLDETPLSGCTNWLGDMFNNLMGSWGLGTLGSAAANAMVDKGADGKIRFLYTDERMLEMLKWLNGLWNDGVMDRELFSQDSAQLMAKADGNLVGSFLMVNNPTIIGKNVADYAGMPILEGPHGDKLWAAISPKVMSTGTFAITSVCPYPEAAMRWVDYFYSEEGVRLLRMGVEGETYRTLEDGSVVFLENITNNPNGLTMDQAVGQFTVTPGGGLPQIMMEKFDKGHTNSPQVQEAAKLIEPYYAAELWRPVFTVEEQNRINVLTNDIYTYVREMRVKFITGAEPLSNWDGYVSQLEKMGLAELVSLFQAAYDR